jgi:hypothetical protein
MPPDWNKLILKTIERFVYRSLKFQVKTKTEENWMQEEFLIYVDEEIVLTEDFEKS